MIRTSFRGISSCNVGSCTFGVQIFIVFVTRSFSTVLTVDSLVSWYRQSTWGFSQYKSCLRRTWSFIALHTLWGTLYHLILGGCIFWDCNLVWGHWGRFKRIDWACWVRVEWVNVFVWIDFFFVLGRRYRCWWWRCTWWGIFSSLLFSLLSTFSQW